MTKATSQRTHLETELESTMGGGGVEFLKAAHRKLSLNIWKHSLKDVKEFPWAYENRV